MREGGVDTDLMLTVGIFVLALTLPALLNAYSSSSPPRGAAILLLVSAVLIVTALVKNPSGYEFREIPDVVVRTIQRFVG